MMPIVYNLYEYLTLSDNVAVKYIKNVCSEESLGHNDLASRARFSKMLIFADDVC